MRGLTVGRVLTGILAFQITIGAFLVLGDMRANGFRLPGMPPAAPRLRPMLAVARSPLAAAGVIVSACAWRSAPLVSHSVWSRSRKMARIMMYVVDFGLTVNSSAGLVGCCLQKPEDGCK